MVTGSARVPLQASNRAFEPATPFVVSSSAETLVAEGCIEVLEGDRRGLAAEAAAVLAARRSDGSSAVLVGALPFEADSPAHLFVPQSITRTPGRFLAGTPAVAPAVAPGRVVARPPRKDYERLVARALSRMAAGGTNALRKVVLARTLVVEPAGAIDPDAVLARLAADEHVTAFSIPLPAERGWRALVGATPERLVKRMGRRVSSVPLAGSARRSEDPAEDRAAAEWLLRSAKDHREHETVVEWVADRLSPLCAGLTIPSQPSLACTSSMWHLATRIEGDLRSAETSSLELAEALHPTPAVAGLPLDEACETIGSLEGFDRGYFGGAIGWCAANGDGEWLVAIRCAEVTAKSAVLYAGAGIVPGSVPEKEADETSAKFTAMLGALCIDELSVAAGEMAW